MGEAFSDEPRLIKLKEEVKKGSYIFRKAGNSCLVPKSKISEGASIEYCPGIHRFGKNSFNFNVNSRTEATKEEKKKNLEEDNVKELDSAFSGVISCLLAFLSL